MPRNVMQKRWRRFRAYTHYLRRPLINFLPLLIMLLVVLVAGSVCFHKLYQRPLGYAEAVFVTWGLLSNQSSIDFPDSRLLQGFFFVLPPLGLIVILDGIIRFSYHVLRRDETATEWVRAMCKTMKDHVVLCGLGKLGLRTLQQLVAMGEQVAVLEKDPNCPNLAYARKNGVPVRIGHSREEGVFEDLNVAEAKSMILATNDDLANLEMALDGRRLKPGIRVVIRMFDQELATKLRDSLDLKLTFSTSELAAPLFATSSSDPSVVNSFYVGDRLLIVADVAINNGSGLDGTPIRELGWGDHAFVLSHTRGAQATAFPAGDTVLQAGDRIMLQAEPATLKRIHGVNGDM